MVKSTNEILSEILRIITSGLPLPDIKVQLEDIANLQNLSNDLQKQISHYTNIISDNSDREVDLLRTFIQMFSSYNTDLHSFFQDWLCNNMYVKETLTDIKTNQIISTDYQARLNHQTLAIKEDTDTIAHLMQTQKQQMDIMSDLMHQEISNTNNISILADISSQTLYSIERLVNKVESIDDNMESIKDTVKNINDKMPEPGPLPPRPVPPGPTPPVPPIPPVPPVPPVPPKPEILFYCQHCNRMVTNCPQTGRKYCTYYETKAFPVYDPKKIIRERDFNKWLNDKN